MRPGYLNDLEGFWFGNIGDDYFETIDINSANPIYTIRDRVEGRTADEFKAFDFQPGWSSTNIPRESLVDEYQRNPYV